MPKVLKIMGNDGLYLTPATARKLLSKSMEHNKVEAAKEILALLDSQKVQVVDEVRQLVTGDPHSKLGNPHRSP